MAFKTPHEVKRCIVSAFEAEITGIMETKFKASGMNPDDKFTTWVDSFNNQHFEQEVEV